MSLDQRGRRAAESLREQVHDDVVAARMLASLPRTRARRRMAVAAPLAAVAVAVVAVFTGARGHEAATPTGPAPTAPTGAPTPTGHGNGVLFGDGDQSLRYPRGLHAPPLGDGSSPTWSPDGRRIAVLAGGILITDASTGRTSHLPCPSCQEIAWSPDGRTFAAPGVDGMPLGLVDALSGQVTQVPLAGVSSVRSVTWAPESDRLAFLVTSPQRVQGAYTVGRDGAHLHLFSDYPTSLDHDPGGRSVLQAVRWAPTRDRIAVLSATPTSRGGVVGGPYQLVAQDYRSDGSGVNVLATDGYCACGGFQPNLVWSPDGTGLAMFAEHARPPVRRIDGDGHAVQVQYVVGSGPLSWQPLPRVP